MIVIALLAAAAMPGIYGPGDMSCEAVIKAENTQRVGDYVTGIWSGMNMAGNTPEVGHTTDARGILLQVLEVCQAYPKLKLAYAVLGVHMKFEKRHY